jgi:hypothetical protein
MIPYPAGADRLEATNEAGALTEVAYAAMAYWQNESPNNNRSTENVLRVARRNSRVWDLYEVGVAALSRTGAL